MKKLLIILIFYNFKGCVLGQTLVPNPSFELITSCPTDGGYPCPYTNLGSFEFVENWFNPTCTSSDIFNSCANSTNPIIGIPNNIMGFQNAINGNGYAGIWCINGSNFYGEYITSNLTKPLKNGVSYCVSFYISFTNDVENSFTGINTIGSFFSNGNPDSTGNILSGQNIPVGQVINSPELIINDSTNWILIKGKFTATGGEDHITIGNFTPDSLINGNGGYYYVDEVNVTECRPPVLGNDTTMIWGNGIYIGDSAVDISTYSWSPTTGLSAPNSYFTLARPDETTTYTLTKITPCDTTSESITIEVLTEDESFRILPNLNTGSFTLNYFHDYPLKLHIYNSIGQLVFNADLPEGRDISMNYNLPQLAAGNYIITLRNFERIVFKEKMVVVK